MKSKIVIFLIFFIFVSNTNFADNQKKKCPKNVYIPGSKQYKGKKCISKNKVKNAKYY